jgi:hypothetical protein
MEDINKKKLSGETTANQLADKLTSGIFKQLSNHELDIFKQQLANRLNLVQDGPPSNINESVFSSDYFTNLSPKGRWNDRVEVMVYKNEDGSYNLGLNVSTISGNGPMADKKPKFADRAIPMDQFTADHVLKRVNTAYPNLNDKSQQELTDFVNDIPSQLRAIEVKKGESPLRERLKDMIRKELMGGNEDEAALRDTYLRKFNVYKNMKKNNRSDFETTQAMEELIDAAKAYGIDLPIK